MKVACKQKETLLSFQKSIDDTVVLLLELKAAPGLSRVLERDIELAVEELQGIVRDLPTITSCRDSFELVFGVIKRAIELVQRVFK